MYRVYCLIDPLDKKPFYVGATATPLTARLSGHINEVKTYCWQRSEKILHIENILKSNRRPKVRLLIIATLHSVDHYEKFFYDLLIKQGFTLLQKKTAFTYSKKVKTLSANKAHYQQVKKYMQLRYKNIIILIW